MMVTEAVAKTTVLAVICDGEDKDDGSGDDHHHHEDGSGGGDDDDDNDADRYGVQTSNCANRLSGTELREEVLRAPAERRAFTPEQQLRLGILANGLPLE